MKPRYACRACGGPGAELFRKRGYAIAGCSSCGCRFVPDGLVDPPPYDERYFAGACRVAGYASYLADRDLVLANFARRVQWLAPLARGPRLLDVGAAYGFLLAAARDQGFDVLGVEPAAGCAELARRDLGVEIVTGRIEEVDLPERSFDVVTLFDVVEHLARPALALERVRSLLRDGGLIVVETGDLEGLLSRVCGRRWYFYDPPQHLTFFGRRSLVSLLEREGFTAPVAIGHLGRWVSLRNFSYQLARALGDGLPANALRALAASPLGSWRLSVPDRGNAFILAARPEGSG